MLSGFQVRVLFLLDCVWWHFTSSSDEDNRLVDNFPCWKILIFALARGKFYHFYGQPGARLEADMSVYTQEDCGDESHIFFSFLNFLFFFALASYVQELKSIWVDDTINHSRWKKFASNLTTGWSGFTIYVSFLIIYSAKPEIFSSLQWCWL